MIPGTSVRSRRPDGGRFAGRRAACTCRRRSSRRSPRGTTLTAATRSAASSAQPKLSTMKVFSSTSEASFSTTALSDQDEHEAEREHERQPQRGEQRREHRVQRGDDGGHGERAAVPATSTPGRIIAATPSDAAVSAHESSRRSGLNLRPLRLPGDGLPIRRPAALTSLRVLRGPLLRLLLRPLRLLLCDLDLGVAVGLPDEQLAAGPAEDGNDEDRARRGRSRRL